MLHVDVTVTSGAGERGDNGGVVWCLFVMISPAVCQEGTRQGGNAVMAVSERGAGKFFSTSLPKN